MSAHQKDLETLKDKDKDSQEMRHIEPEGTSINYSSSSKENHNDNDIPVRPNDSSVPQLQARQVDAPRRSGRLTEPKNSVSISGGNTQAAAPKGGKIEPSTKSKPPPKAKAQTAKPKVCATKPPPKTKTKATSKSKRNTKKRNTIAPDPEAPITIEELLPFQQERRHLYDAVEYFKDRLARIHVSLDKEADSPSRSISRDIMLLKAFEVEMENLVEYEFPMVVEASRSLAQAVMGSPKELSPEDEDDKHQEGKNRKGSREPARKTSTNQINKKRSRQEDDDGEEDAGRHNPRQKSILPKPQNTSGQVETSTSTSDKRPREAADPDDDYRHSKRSRRFWKGKGRAKATHTSDDQAPPQHLLELEDAMQAVSASGSSGRHASGTHQDPILEIIDEGEIRSESTSSHDSLLPQQNSSRRTPGPSCPPDRPTIRIMRPAP